MRTTAMNARYARGPLETEFETEWGSYLVSVSDAISGLIFIFVLLLFVFAVQFQQATDVQRQVAAEQQQVVRAQGQLIEELTNTDVIRREMLEAIEAALREQGLVVRVDLEQGILHLPESILFPSGSATLRPAGEQALAVLARVLLGVLPCYAEVSGPLESGCERDRHSVGLEAVFIEGHTDNIPIATAEFPDNWALSAARAIRTFDTMIQIAPDLDKLRNARGEPLFTVSGYADRRPVAENDTPEERQLNRRIDLRFVMMSPTTPAVVEELQRSLEVLDGADSTP